MEQASDNCGSKEEINFRIDYFIGQTVDRYLEGLRKPQIWQTQDGKFVKRYFNGKMYDQVEAHLKRLCLTRMNEILRSSGNPPRNLVDSKVDENRANNVNYSQKVLDEEEYYADNEGINSDGGPTAIFNAEEDDREAPPLPPMEDPTMPFYDMNDNQAEFTPFIPKYLDCPNFVFEELGAADWEENAEKIEHLRRRISKIPRYFQFMGLFKRCGQSELSLRPITRLFQKYVVSRQCERDMLSLWNVIPAEDGTYPHPKVWDNLLKIYEIRDQILRAMVTHITDVNLAERHAIRHLAENPKERYPLKVEEFMAMVMKIPQIRSFSAPPNL